METIPDITMTALNQEHRLWTQEYGTGRNQSGLRFGQYLHRKYNVPFGMKGEPDGFYAECADDAYLEIANNITLASEK